MYLQTVKIIISYEGGERVNHAILMSSGAENIDFMIHGIVQYEIFGHKVWITTSHVCILIVMLLMMALASTEVCQLYQYHFYLYSYE